MRQCGKKFTVKCTGPRNGGPHPCTGKSVTMKVVDQCPGCPSTMDLSREAFKIIAKPVAGIINIDYKNGRGRGRGHSSSSRFQCQLCGKAGHLVDHCYYRFDTLYKSTGYRPPSSPQANFGNGPSRNP
ncbi:hypothetical protein J1N35_025357 [Gossypium stocksii]|uniref:Expansin-like EG45 domain-containing protein n=1 Tax=Gossypium stocksii TaxID=47602 RepID=A0A9D3V6A6_9ROSI|nr:hypothetical protein J1N35_025357 [Gossypium stocksii]